MVTGWRFSTGTPLDDAIAARQLLRAASIYIERQGVGLKR